MALLTTGGAGRGLYSLWLYLLQAGLRAGLKPAETESGRRSRAEVDRALGIYDVGDDGDDEDDDDDEDGDEDDSRSGGFGADDRQEVARLRRQQVRQQQMDQYQEDARRKARRQAGQDMPDDDF